MCEFEINLHNAVMYTRLRNRNDQFLCTVISLCCVISRIGHTKKEQTTLKRKRIARDLHSNFRYQIWKVVARTRVQCVSESTSTKLLNVARSLSLSLSPFCHFHSLSFSLILSLSVSITFAAMKVTRSADRSLFVELRSGSRWKSISQSHWSVNKSLSDADSAHQISLTVLWSRRNKINRGILCDNITAMHRGKSYRAFYISCAVY